MTLDDVRDQPRAVTLLRRALESGRVAHAYAFVGPAGAGRTTTALAFAAALLCPQGGRHARGACRACESVAAGRHPDLHLIVPTPPESNPRGTRLLRIGAIRELARQASLKPLTAARKVFILDDADRMTDDAPQAFLKTLEEPPAATVMILILARARAVPATVLSRCHIVRFAPRGDDRAEAVGEVRELVAEVRAKGSDALFRRAQHVDRERAERLVDACWLLQRDWLLARAGVTAALLADPAHAEETAREAALVDVDEILAGIATCREAREALAVNVAPRLTVEVVVSRLALATAGAA